MGQKNDHSSESVNSFDSGAIFPPRLGHDRDRNNDFSTFFRLFFGSPGTLQEASWMIESHLEGRMRLFSDPTKVMAGSETQQQVENMAQPVDGTEGFVRCPVAEALQVITQCENPADQCDFSLRARLYESSRAVNEG